MRRLAIGALFVVAAAACGRGGSPTSPQEAQEPGGSGSLYALWPEHTLEAGMHAQARTDAGQHPWRLDPMVTAERFARDVLGWEEVIVRACPFEEEPYCGPGDTSRPNTSFLYLSRSRGSSDLIVQLDRLIRPGEGGIWSVSWVGDAGEDLPAGFERPPGVEEDPSSDVGPGAEIPASATVLLRSSRPDAEGVVAGYVYWGACQTEGFGTSVRKGVRVLEFEVATREANTECLRERSTADGSSLARPVDGIVFVATTRSGPVIDAARLGVWLFDPPRRTPETADALDRIVDVAAMPVRFVPADVNAAAPGWKGLWPQHSRSEAERAQASAHRGEDQYSWQLGPDGDEVVLRYAREKLGWSRPYPLGALVRRAWLRRFQVIDCAPGPNPDYPEIDCAPPANRSYPAAYITLERLLRRDEGGLWFITGIKPTVVHQPEPASEDEVRRVVSAFMERRLLGSGAEEFLSPEASGRFGGELGLSPLYSSTGDFRYARYEIVFVEGPLWPFSDFEVGVRILPASGGAIEETLFVGPGIDLSGERRPLLIEGGRHGLTGP